MTTPDLARQILAAIEGAEQDARDAVARKGGTWEVADPGEYRWGQDEQDAEILAGGKPIISCSYEYGGPLLADHIARNDPNAALRRYAADRRRLERHTPIPDHGRFSDDWADRRPNPGDCDCGERPKVCGACRDQVGDPLEAPCPDLLDLADSYGVAPAAESSSAAGHDTWWVHDHRMPTPKEAHDGQAQ